MKKLHSILLVAAISISLMSSVAIYSNAEAAANSTISTNFGWRKESNKYIYINASGKKLYGWNRLNGLWYYFNRKGQMVTGTQDIGGRKHIFDEDGVYVKTMPIKKNVGNVNVTDTNSKNTSVPGKKIYYDGKGNKLGTGKKYLSNASAYAGHTITASGQRPRWGTIAVDPRVIPLGSRVYIPYFDKVFIANDTGGIIKGTKIDIFMTSTSQMYKFGRRNIDIIVLD